MKEKLLEALPIFIGATLGVYFYASVLPPAVVLLCLAGLGLLGVIAGWEARQLLVRHPVAAVRLWQVQALFPMSLLAAGGYLVSAAVAHLPALVAALPLVDLPADAVERGKRVDTISAALATAVTTFCGALVMDDLEKGTGGWWPPAQLKQAFAASFGPMVTKRRAEFEPLPQESDAAHAARLATLIDRLAEYETLKQAVYEETISVRHPTGWSLPAMVARAEIVQAASRTA